MTTVDDEILELDLSQISHEHDEFAVQRRDLDEIQY